MSVTTSLSELSVRLDRCYQHVLRQNVFLMADGRDLRGLGVSVAASPTSSVPEKLNAAVTKTAHTPLNPFASAPGSCQYLSWHLSIACCLLDGAHSLAADVLAVRSTTRSTTAVEHDPDDKEHDDDGELKRRGKELFFGIAEGTK